MADEADIAEEIEQRQRDQALANALANRGQSSRGECHWCEEPFPPGDTRIYCDSDCAEDYHRHRRGRT